MRSGELSAEVTALFYGRWMRKGQVGEEKEEGKIRCPKAPKKRGNNKSQHSPLHGWVLFLF